jgi:hypothetical protein
MTTSTASIANAPDAIAISLNMPVADFVAWPSTITAVDLSTAAPTRSRLTDPIDH